MGRIADRTDDGLLRGQVGAGLMYEPHLDVIRVASKLPGDQCRALGHGGGADDRRIVKLQGRVGNHRNQRACHRDLRSNGGGTRRIAHLEVPHRPADIHNRGDSAGDPDLKGRRQASLVASKLGRVRNDAGQVGGIRPCIGIAGLEEMDMRIGEPRNQPLSGTIDHLRARGDCGRCRRAERLDTVGPYDHCLVGIDRVSGLAFRMYDRNVGKGQRRADRRATGYRRRDRAASRSDTALYFSSPLPLGKCSGLLWEAARGRHNFPVRTSSNLPALMARRSSTAPRAAACTPARGAKAITSTVGSTDRISCWP